VYKYICNVETLATTDKTRGRYPATPPKGYTMKKYSKEYLDFELKHTRELVVLHHKTGDEELRLQILEVRKTLERIFLMGSK